MKKRIILLDLNGTLSANAKALGMAFFHPAYPVEREEYHYWLVKLFTGHHVALITARSTSMEARTLERMRQTLGGWMPNSVHFKTNPFMSAPDWKNHVLQTSIFPRFGTNPSRYLALESNYRTRAMYESHRIFAIPVPRGGEWSTLPNPQEKPHVQQSIFGDHPNPNCRP